MRAKALAVRMDMVETEYKTHKIVEEHKEKKQRTAASGSRTSHK